MNDVPHDSYLPHRHWVDKGYTYPSKNQFYNWTRPTSLRTELIAAGVIMQIGGRWLMNRAKFEQFCMNKARQQSNLNAA